MQEMQALVKDYILKEFLPGENPDLLEPTTELMTSGILDSLATLRFVAYLEETFNIAVAPHELIADNLNTLDDITEFVTSKQA